MHPCLEEASKKHKHPISLLRVAGVCPMHWQLWNLSIPEQCISTSGKDYGGNWWYFTTDKMFEQSLKYSLLCTTITHHHQGLASHSTSLLVHLLSRPLQCFPYHTVATVSLDSSVIVQIMSMQQIFLPLSQWVDWHWGWVWLCCSWVHTLSPKFSWSQDMFLSMPSP